MTPDELKSLPKGTFIVMKTGFYPMKVKLKLFFKWGIRFEESYEVLKNGSREVHYANRSELLNSIMKKYYSHLEQPGTESGFEEAGDNKKKNENLKTLPNAEQNNSQNDNQNEDTDNFKESISEHQEKSTGDLQASSVEQNPSKQRKVVIRTEIPPQEDNGNE